MKNNMFHFMWTGKCRFLLHIIFILIWTHILFDGIAHILLVFHFYIYPFGLTLTCIDEWLGKFSLLWVLVCVCVCGAINITFHSFLWSHAILFLFIPLCHDLQKQFVLKPWKYYYHRHHIAVMVLIASCLFHGIARHV